MKRINTARYFASMHKSANTIETTLLLNGQETEVVVGYSIGGGMVEEINPQGEKHPDIRSLIRKGDGENLEYLLEDPQVVEQLTQDIQNIAGQQERDWGGKEDRAWG